MLTFDDGYVNNLRFALPVLQRHHVPAILFVSTWHTISGEPFWFDRVTVPIQVEALEELDLREAGLRCYRFHPEDGPRRWDDVQRLLDDIKGLGNPGCPKVDRVLAACDKAAGEQGREALRDYRPLTPGEIQAMYSTGLLCIGSHGHRHEILTALGDDDLDAACRTSREVLESILQVSPVDLAYPNGDADLRVIRSARAAGFRRGYTIDPGLTRATTDGLRLPRLLIGGYDTLDVLAFKLNRLFAQAAIKDRRKVRKDGNESSPDDARSPRGDEG